MDALDRLHQSHEEARAAFREIEAATPTDRGGKWVSLQTKLSLHERVEEQFVYHPVVADAGERDPEVRSDYERHEQQVSDLVARLNAVGNVDSRSGGWLEGITPIRDALEQHIHFEESEFWPHIRQVWSQEKLEEAGRRVDAALTAGSIGAVLSGAAGEVSEASRNLAGGAEGTRDGGHRVA
jgi:hypothetical protein